MPDFWWNQPLTGSVQRPTGYAFGGEVDDQSFSDPSMDQEPMAAPAGVGGGFSTETAGIPRTGYTTAAGMDQTDPALAGPDPLPQEEPAPQESKPPRASKPKGGGRKGGRKGGGRRRRRTGYAEGGDVTESGGMTLEGGATFGDPDSPSGGGGGGGGKIYSPPEKKGPVEVADDEEAERIRHAAGDYAEGGEVRGYDDGGYVDEYDSGGSSGGSYSNGYSSNYDQERRREQEDPVREQIEREARGGRTEDESIPQNARETAGQLDDFGGQSVTPKEPTGYGPDSSYDPMGMVREVLNHTRNMFGLGDTGYKSAEGVAERNRQPAEPQEPASNIYGGERAVGKIGLPESWKPTPEAPYTPSGRYEELTERAEPTPKTDTTPGPTVGRDEELTGQAEPAAKPDYPTYSPPGRATEDKTPLPADAGIGDLAGRAARKFQSDFDTSIEAAHDRVTERFRPGGGLEQGIEGRHQAIGEAIGRNITTPIQEGLRRYLGGENADPPQRLAAKLQDIAASTPGASEAEIVQKAVADPTIPVEERAGALAGMRQSYDHQVAMALGAFENGNTAAAIHLAEKAHDRVPDGQTLKFTPTTDGQGVLATVETARGGQPIQVPMTLPQLRDYLVGPATSFDHVVENGVAKNLQIASGNQDTDFSAVRRGGGGGGQQGSGGGQRGSGGGRDIVLPTNELQTPASYDSRGNALAANGVVIPPSAVAGQQPQAQQPQSQQSGYYPPGARPPQPWPGQRYDDKGNPVSADGSYQGQTFQQGQGTYPISMLATPEAKAYAAAHGGRAPPGYPETRGAYPQELQPDYRQGQPASPMKSWTEPGTPEGDRQVTGPDGKPTTQGELDNAVRQSISDNRPPWKNPDGTMNMDVWHAEIANRRREATEGYKGATDTRGQPGQQGAPQVAPPNIKDLLPPVRVQTKQGVREYPNPGNAAITAHNTNERTRYERERRESTQTATQDRQQQQHRAESIVKYYNELKKAGEDISPELEAAHQQARRHLTGLPDSAFPQQQQPGGGQGNGAARSPVRVSSPDEARRLPPGTPFITPDGRTGTR